jgi:hypothetical protein
MSIADGFALAAFLAALAIMALGVTLAPADGAAFDTNDTQERTER